MTTIHRSLKYLISTWLQQGNCCCHSEILRQLIWYLMWWLKILPVDAANQNTVPNDGREMSWASYLILTGTSDRQSDLWQELYIELASSMSWMTFVLLQVLRRETRTWNFVKHGTRAFWVALVFRGKSNLREDSNDIWWSILACRELP